MIKVKDVERYTIPFKHDHEGVIPGLDATTVAELIAALLLLPRDAVVSTDFNGSGIYATHYKPDIEA